MHRMLIAFSWRSLQILLTIMSVSAVTKNAIVTGANRGIGLELCRQLAAEGDKYSTIFGICRKSSDGLQDLASKSEGKVKVVENIEITADDAITKIQNYFASGEATPIPIHLLVHNAGAYGPPQHINELYTSQTLENIDAEKMRFAFELNTLAPLLLTKTLVPNLKVSASKEDPSKVVIISSAMGSIEDNTSGGHYGYRMAKAGVNMIGKSLSVDLKESNIAVSLVHPGFVYTDFGGENKERRPGQRDVDESTRGVLEAVESTTLDTTGTFYHGNYGEGVKTMPW